jgi:MFS family permease
MQPAKKMHQTSAMEPLKVAPFRAIWLSALCTNTGLFIQDVGAAWLMASLTNDPFMTALMQTAATLPFFLLALPAGALADLFDRRKLVLLFQFWMLTAAATLGFITLTGHITPTVLLTLTFLLFVGGACTSPAWSAITPDLVPRKHLEPAIGLGSAGYNLSRGAGAAIGGLIVASFGSAWAFIVNACCYSVMINTLLRWKYRRDQKPNENIVRAILSGVNYVRDSIALKAVLVRTVMFATASSALWALVPLLARNQLKLNSAEYGMLISGFGIGTLAGAIMLPKLRTKLTLDQMSVAGTILFAASLAVVACAHGFWHGIAGMLGCGIAWTIKNSSLNVAVQLAAPKWVRARAYSVYLLVFQGCAAVGSMIWGKLASMRSMEEAMLFSAVILLLGMFAGIWHKLAHAERLEITEAMHRNEPEVAAAIPDPAA